MARFSWKKRLLILPPVLLGGILLAIAPAMKADPPKAADTTGKKVVRVLKVTPMDIQPTATGYGHTQPARQWQAQAEIEGRVVWVSERLKEGNLLREGEPLLKLDPSAYQLAITKLTASLDVSKLKNQTLGESLAIATKNYQIQKKEYERTERLVKTGHVSQTDRDKAVRELLTNEQQLQSLKNEQAINLAEQRVLQTELEMAKRDLRHTSIEAPFDIRITAKQVDLASWVSKGETLLTADGIDTVEVLAQFPLGKMRPLRRDSQSQPLAQNLHSNLTALIELNAGDKIIRWQGSVDRSGGQINAQTQSQTIVVSVPNPYQKASPGQKPPLIRDTFVKVTLKAPALKKQLLLPVNALHGDNVYLVKDGKLAITPVEVDFVQGQTAVIRKGISAGDLVVVSQLQPAAEGMALKPQPDKALSQWLKQQAGGEL